MWQCIDIWKWHIIITIEKIISIITIIMIYNIYCTLVYNSLPMFSLWRPMLYLYLEWSWSRYLTAMQSTQSQTPYIVQPTSQASSIFGVTRYRDVFERLGELPGEYKIQLKPDIIFTVNLPCRLVLRSVVKAEFDTMVDKEITIPLTESTTWVPSMVVVQKNGKLRICLIIWNFSIRQSRGVITHSPPLRKLLDAKSGFWQVKLEEASSYLKTFSTAFGRFRWRWMPFGISSAPKVWHQRMNEIGEGLSRVEVIADDFLICVFGATKEEGAANSDDNLCLFRPRPIMLKLLLIILLSSGQRIAHYACIMLNIML